MRSLFRSKHRVTQVFGSDHTLTINNKEIAASVYYGKWGLKGHEGLDCVPTGTQWDVLCLADGVVVTDEDNAVSGSYGRYITVWHPKLRLATQYCHLKENYVSKGQIITMGDKIGYMGGTGNVQGAHVHLNVFEVDENGIRLNRKNGYLGGIDPLPFLEENVPVEVAPDTVPIEKVKLKDLERCKEGWNQVRAKLNVEDSVAVVLAEIDKFIGLAEALRKKEKQIAEYMEKIESLEDQLKKVVPQHAETVKDVQEVTETVSDQGKTITEVSTGLQEVKEAIKNPKSGWKKVWEGVKELLGWG
ncbi:MAG: peptidoglycan DD-metalloendopeptidase family protein [Candidatus Scalindua sp.]|nr:peptidoglycan DD-metalloendopeptidase family protein [Candidatus Scalindua sp.]